MIIAWDDSDGWYDHAFAKATSPSFDAEADQLDGPGKCGTGTPRAGVDGKPVNGRCGPGTRLPFLVISPWAKANYVSHEPISLASVVRFIEDNWLHGERLGGGSFDAAAGSIMDMFDFTARRQEPAALSRSGDRQPVASAARIALTGGMRRRWFASPASVLPVAPAVAVAAVAARCRCAPGSRIRSPASCSRAARTPIRCGWCARRRRRCRRWRSSGRRVFFDASLSSSGRLVLRLLSQPASTPTARPATRRR